jgi:hypothetical protein
MNYGETYTLKEGRKAEDALTSIYLTDNKMSELKEIMEMYMQLAVNESGVSNANDGQVAGLESQKLATGIRNIEASSQEIFSTFIDDLEGGIEDVIDIAVQTMVKHLDGEEVFDLFDGQGSILETITPEEIRDIDLNVEILLTQANVEQAYALSQQASELVERYYALNPMVQERVTQFYRDMLRSLQVPNPETVIAPLALPENTMAPGEETGNAPPV